MQPMGYAGGYAPPGASPMAMTGAAYEFNDLENQTIARTARFARMWGVISIISGVLVLVAGIILAFVVGAIGAAAASSSSLGMKGAMFGPAMAGAVGVALIPTALVSIICGIFYLQSGGALRMVVDTQGNDIPLLMESIKALARAFLIEAIMMIIAFVVGLGIGIAGMGAH